ncbi:hypothetical protein RD110_10795 [Rhodoferax koreense]|uniref:HTH cro/C1-type domain-containing protein n=2 Tax=Rhodoferax koreensis TaxID=1842727 RepID=A0A1P8JV45_9BURK|nr:hypothetical protein RD110_10795 [Rhodoferax koreense]
MKWKMSRLEISMAEMAKAVEMSVQSVHALIHRDSKISTEKAARIAGALGWTLDEMLAQQRKMDEGYERVALLEEDPKAYTQAVLAIAMAAGRKPGLPKGKLPQEGEL